MDAIRRQKIQDFIDSLSDDEIYELYRQLAEKVRQIREYAERISLNSFQPLERVYFHKNRRHIEGVVIQINRRTASILTDDGERWTVSPQYLTKVAITPPQPNANSKGYVEGTVVSHNQTSKRRKKKKKRR